MNESKVSTASSINGHMIALGPGHSIALYERKEMPEKIERLHAASEARQARMLAVPGSVAAAARRHLLNVMSLLCGDASKIRRTIG
jgi:hypothetical protein